MNERSEFMTSRRGQSASDQNAPTNPASVNNFCDAAPDRAFQSGDSRPSNQDCDKVQRFLAGMISPIGISVCADHVWTCSSDLKNRIVCHV